MLLVVFGAGASYDSDPSRPAVIGPHPGGRPPLASQLFHESFRFTGAFDSFPQCQPIIPYLQNPPPGESVEGVLERLQTEAREYPKRHEQLAAIRYYLHFMLWKCQQAWNEVVRGVTNYKTLLDQLEHWRGGHEPVCLVTFNYDTMLEEALPTVGVRIQGLPDYIASDSYKLIKLHGSVNWAREVNRPADPNRNVWEIVAGLIAEAAILEFTGPYRMVSEYPIARSGTSALFPALAIPVETKRSYECPEEHLEALRKCVAQTTKLVLIGWRASEAHFLGLLNDCLPKSVRVLAVAGGQDGAKEVVQRLQQAGIQGDFQLSQFGFTDLVLRREAYEFVKS